MREHGAVLLLGGMLLVLRNAAGCPDGEKQRNTMRLMRVKGTPDGCILDSL